MIQAKWIKRVVCLLVLCVGALGMVSRSYGYNALVPLMISNLSRLQSLVVELAMSDFEGAARAANSSTIRGPLNDEGFWWGIDTHMCR